MRYTASNKRFEKDVSISVDLEPFNMKICFGEVNIILKSAYRPPIYHAAISYKSHRTFYVQCKWF